LLKISFTDHFVIADDIWERVRRTFLAAVRVEGIQRALILGAEKLRITHHICGYDCCQSTLSGSHSLDRDVPIRGYLHQQGIDTTTPAGKAMFQMSAVFAEFERAMIRERVKAGLERARAKGKKLGRPTVSAEVEEAIVAARATGKGIRRIASELGVGVSTVRRVIGPHENADAASPT